VKEDVENHTPRSPRTHNLSKEERDAFQSLQSNPNIIIKKADKGSAVVLMDLGDYIKEAERQLSDTDFYIPTDSDLSEKHIKEIEEILKTMVEKDEIDWETFASLCPSSSKNRTANFYFLPKIHKKEVKGRPIISGNGCPTEQISAFVDEHIKGYVKTLDSYVKDTTDFIRKLEKFSEENKESIDNEILLVTMDVTSLYTNIPNHEGIVSVIKTLEPTYNRRVSLDSLGKLLKAVLHKNNFQFNGKNYLQIGGTAMGTRLAPSYANLFMGRLEQRELKRLEQRGLKPALYLRFIDDIFMIWTLGETKLNEFTTHMNEAHPTIKFTCEFSRESVNFLDTTARVDKILKLVYTELYTKDTDTHNYLHYTSSHPAHCKKGGPYGEFLRIRRNCHKLEDFEKHSNARKQDYLRRGYPTNVLDTALDKARHCDRKELLKEKPKDMTKNRDRIPLIVTFNPANPNLRKIIDKHWHLVEKSRNSEAFTNKPLVAYRRNKNISDKLVRAKCNPSEKTSEKPTLKCKTPWLCKLCPKPSDNGRYKSTTTGREYQGPRNYSCKTKNVIYLITCKKCKKQYVGETSRSFEIRMKEHLRYIRNPRQYDEPTGRHFNGPNHKISDFSCRVIYKMYNEPIRNCPIRQSKEEHFIDQLQTREPKGLNERYGRQKFHN